MSHQEPDAPPPYSAVDPLSSGTASGNTATHQQAPQVQAQAPQVPQVPQRPQQEQWRPQPSSRPHDDYSYILNDQGPNLPWKYPSGYRCTKCNNTGYKIKNGKSCKNCWERFAHQPNVQYQYTPSYNSGIRIPFTDYRINDDLTVSNGYAPQPMMMPMQPVPTGPQYYGQALPPRVVRPGDPSIGGYLCGKCRGTGRISVMFFDDDLCHVCNGVGRVFKR